jgi:hypothetical protein
MPENACRIASLGANKGAPTPCATGTEGEALAWRLHPSAGKQHIQHALQIFVARCKMEMNESAEYGNRFGGDDGWCRRRFSGSSALESAGMSCQLRRTRKTGR